MSCELPEASVYLDLAESVVRQTTAWQTPEGMMGDPYNPPGVESSTATGRYCAALGHLLATGRCHDLLPQAVLALDWSCCELDRHYRSGEQWQGAQFKVKDMMVLYEWFRETPECLEPGQLDRWTAQLSFDPECLYYGDRNWVFYSTAAETLRVHCGLTSGWDYVDRMLESEMEYWTPEGMYRDPNDPVTYDLTARQGLAMMLHYGYAGRYVEWMHGVLHRGAMATLQFISPCGVAPCGGRSNQFHIMEGMIAYFAEWQARQELAAGDPAVAAELRRVALSAAQAVTRWMLREPFASLKHNLGEQELYGQDGYHTSQSARSGYGLLAANLFAGAYRVADQALSPAPAPDPRPRFLYLHDAFHRLWATVGPYHLQLDTRAQPGYDATGLVRLHRRGVPAETALNASISGQPRYVMPMSPAPRSVALGAGWEHGGEWVYLSEATRETHRVEVSSPQCGEDLKFAVTYTPESAAWPAGRLVLESYRLSRNGLQCTVTVPGAARVRLQIPVIETDGESTSVIEIGPGTVVVRYRGHCYRVALEGCGRESMLEPWAAPNRNGMHRVVVFEVPGEAVTYTATLD